MKGFKFKLDKVLEVKSIELRQKQKDLSLATQQRQEAMQVFREKKKMMKAFANQLEKMSSENAGNLNRFYDHYHLLLEGVKKQKEQVATLEEQEENVRRQLIAIQQEQKILEKLREKEWEKYQEEFNKDMQNAIDELAGCSYDRLSASAAKSS